LVVSRLQVNAIKVLSPSQPIKEIINIKQWIVVLLDYYASSHKECLQHQGHKEYPEMTSRSCFIFGEGTQVDLVLDMGPQASRESKASTWAWSVERGEGKKKAGSRNCCQKSRNKGFPLKINKFMVDIF
jgi:hypothetical protein